MAFTFQQVADRARLPLQDSAKDRYPDSELLTYALDAYLLIRRHRPDFLVSAWSTAPAFGTLSLSSNFPLVGDEYLPVVADYVTARAESKDDQSVLEERAKAFFALFRDGVKGG